MLFFGAFIVFCILIFLYGISIYNTQVRLRNACKNAWSQIDVQLQRRYDLIPNLVETAKAYLKHESATLEAVIQARNQSVGARAAAAANPQSPVAMQQLMAAEGALGGALGRLMMVSENYPELKADRTMAQLSEELTSTENRVAFARQAYNDTTMVYNTSRESFPNSLIAGYFQPAIPWEALDRVVEQAPQVRF
jgi:LemA protein